MSNDLGLFYFIVKSLLLKILKKKKKNLVCDPYICLGKIKNNHNCILFTLFNVFLIALLNSCIVLNSRNKIKKLNWTVGIKLDSN